MISMYTKEETEAGNSYWLAHDHTADKQLRKCSNLGRLPPEPRLLRLHHVAFTLGLSHGSPPDN